MGNAIPLPDVTEDQATLQIRDHLRRNTGQIVLEDFLRELLVSTAEVSGFS